MSFLFSKNLLFSTLLLSILVLACQRSEKSSSAQMVNDSAMTSEAPAPARAEMEGKAAEKDALNPFGTSVAAVSWLDSLRKFVRTAQVKFRVRNVLSATLQLEDVALRNRGFVTVSNLHTEVEYRREEPISRDSSVETTRFSVQSHLVLRVPYQQLDTALRAMNRLAEFLDYRNVRAEDVALKMMEDQLLQLRQSIYQQSVNAAAQTAKSSTQLEAADRTLGSRAAADQSRIDRLKLEDAIQYSTIEVDIYQPAQIQQRMVANTEFRPVERGFWASIGDGLVEGALVLRGLAILLAQGWSIILLVVLAVWGIRRWRRGAK